jgi:hypothetical protein
MSPDRPPPNESCVSTKITLDSARYPAGQEGGLPTIPRPLTEPPKDRDTRCQDEHSGPFSRFWQGWLFPVVFIQDFFQPQQSDFESALGLGRLNGCLVSYPFRRMCLRKGRDNRHHGHYHVADMIGDGKIISSNNTDI